MKNISIPLPPLPAQRVIVSYPDGKMGQIDGFIDVIKKQIDTLKTYRQIVIHDAVTGKQRIE